MKKISFRPNLLSVTEFTNQYQFSKSQIFCLIGLIPVFYLWNIRDTLVERILGYIIKQVVGRKILYSQCWQHRPEAAKAAEWKQIRLQAQGQSIAWQTRLGGH